MPGQIQLIVGGKVAMARVEGSMDTEVGDWLYCANLVFKDAKQIRAGEYPAGELNLLEPAASIPLKNVFSVPAASGVVSIDLLGGQPGNQNAFGFKSLA